MLDIVNGNVSALSERLALSNGNRDLREVDPGAREGAKSERLILRSLWCIAESNTWKRFAIGSLTNNGEGSSLRKTFSGTSIRSQAVVEALQVEGCSTGGWFDGNVGVEGQRPKLNEVNWTSCTSVLSPGV